MFNTGRPDLCPEHELLLCLARTRQDDQTIDRIKRLSEGRIDWTVLLHHATRHRVTPLLYHSLQRTVPALVPSNILHELEIQYGAVVRRNLLIVAELNRVIEVLTAAGITPIAFKGATMAILAYHNICLRQFGDLDILVEPACYWLAREALLAEGYRINADWGWECSLVDDMRGICVDIHRAITPDQIPLNLDFQRLLTRLEPVVIATRKIDSLGAEDMLVILAIQLTKDGLGEGPLRLSKICDIAELLRRRPDINWNRVFEDADRLGCRRMVLLGLRVTQELLDASLPHSVEVTVRDEPHLKTLSEYIYHSLFYEQDENRNSPLSRASFHFRVRERWRDSLFPYYREFLLRITPNRKDRAVLPLPPSLGLLYYFIRPLRLAKDYGITLLREVSAKRALRIDRRLRK
jgi:hypothetical protein